MDGVFSDVGGVSIFNRTGDVSGVATRNGSHVQIAYTSTSGPIGNDYPIMTLSLKVRPDAVPGQQSQFFFDPSSLWTLFGQGVTGFKPVPPALITVGGSISITGVVPGGGMLPTGTTVSVRGIGFQPKTQLQTNAKIGPIQFVSPNEIQFTVAEPTEMTGKRIQVVNPDGSKDLYYSYLRGVLAFESAKPLLQRSEPAFSARSYASGALGPLTLDTGGEYSALALQSSSLGSVEVDLWLFGQAGFLLGHSARTLDSGGRMFAEVSELLDGALPENGSWVVVSASKPIQMFSLVARENEGATTPSLPIWAQ
jgi:hypothetical protein